MTRSVVRQADRLPLCEIQAVLFDCHSHSLSWATILLRSLSSVLLAFVCLLGAARAEGVEGPTALNAVYAEAFGPGLAYSLNYERLVVRNLGVRGGVSYVRVGCECLFDALPLEDSHAGSHPGVLTFPVTASYLGIHRGNHSLELGGGVSLTYSGSSGVRPLDVISYRSGIGAFGTILVGYRIQPFRAGFQLRTGLSLLYGPGVAVGFDFPDRWGFIPWLYLSLGAVF